GGLRRPPPRDGEGAPISREQLTSQRHLFSSCLVSAVSPGRPTTWLSALGRQSYSPVMATRAFHSRQAAQRRRERGSAIKPSIIMLTTVLALLLSAVPLAAEAQKAVKVPRIGLLDYGKFWDPMLQRLSELGYVEGRTILFEYRASEGRPERLSTLAQDLVQRGV